MHKMQMQGYEDAKIQKLFPEFVRTLYDQDVVAEDTILLWFRKGANPKGRWVDKGREDSTGWRHSAYECGRVPA